MLTARKLTLLAAVGAAGISAAPAEAATTTAQFAKRADAICRPASAKLKAIPEPSDAAGVVPYLQRSLSVAAPYLKQLRALELPTEKRAEARRAIRGVNQDVTLIRAAITSLKGGADPTATLKRYVKRASAVERTEDRAWRAVGATDCAK